MELALSTRWNSRRHTDGEALAAEIAALGIRQLELGYDLTRDLIPGLQRARAQRVVTIVSVHAYCPVPMGVSRGGPELFLLGDPDPARREKAVALTATSLRLAAEFGARVVIVHAGYAGMRPLSPRLAQLAFAGRAGGWRYAWLYRRLERGRERGVRRPLERVYAGIEKLLPVIEETGVRLALENLPTWEAIPSEFEMFALARRFPHEHVAYWHDLGHGQVREIMGMINHERVLERLAPLVAGLHIHDVRPPLQDHLLPGDGVLDFSRFRAWAARPVPKVIEPSRDAPAERLAAAVAAIKHAWTTPAAAPADRPRDPLYG